MKKLQIRDRLYILPDSWNELTATQLLNVAYARHSLHHSNDNKDYYSLSISLFIILTKIPLKTYLKINSEQWFDLIQHISFLYAEPSFTDNPLPILKCGFIWNRKKIIGPRGLLNDLSFGEFVDADTIYEQINTTKKMELIWLLMAVLYRPERADLRQFKKTEHWNGDVREIYNGEHAKSRAIFLKKHFSEAHAIAVMLYYRASREQKFVKNKNLQVLFINTSGTSSKKATWLDTELEISSGKFGSRMETRQQNWLVVLYELARQKEIAIKSIKK
jgi:hypothetical protein